MRWEPGSAGVRGRGRTRRCGCPHARASPRAVRSSPDASRQPAWVPRAVRGPLLPSAARSQRGREGPGVVRDPGHGSCPPGGSPHTVIACRIAFRGTAREASNASEHSAQSCSQCPTALSIPPQQGPDCRTPFWSVLVPQWPWDNLGLAGGCCGEQGWMGTEGLQGYGRQQ